MVTDNRQKMGPSEREWIESHVRTLETLGEASFSGLSRRFWLDLADEIAGTKNSWRHYRIEFAYWEGDRQNGYYSYTADDFWAMMKLYANSGAPEVTRIVVRVTVLGAAHVWTWVSASSEPFADFLKRIWTTKGDA